ncbi:hypothetical protein AL066_13100 [Pseudomonas nunensis]|nr:hypothetical protein AL066_13100 [Pseudomonas nunensis]
MRSFELDFQGQDQKIAELVISYEINIRPRRCLQEKQPFPALPQLTALPSLPILAPVTTDS